jgi:hypothetical protein
MKDHIKTWIQYLDKLKTRKEIYFKYFESPVIVVVKDKEDGVDYLEKFYQKEMQRLNSFRADLDRFKNEM